MQIGILMCGHTRPTIEEKHGDFDAMFARLLEGRGLTFRAYDVENMGFPGGVEECDGWLLTGSKHGAYEDHPFIPPLEDFIRDASAAKIPMVGICFGHQIIAQALGGRVEKFQGGWSVGRTEYGFEGLGDLQLNAWHQDQVIDLPDGAKTVASNAFCAHAALSYGNHIYTVQPHPELTGPIIAEYVDLLKGTIPDDLMDRAAAETPLPTDEGTISAEIARFFHAAHAARAEAAHA